MKKYSTLIKQYKTQDNKELINDKNDALQEAYCFDDDDCFDLGALCDCSAASCDCSAAMFDGCRSADCLDCDHY